MKDSSTAVLALLRRHPEGVTPLLALEEAQCFRLGARIWDLKQAGYLIRTDLIRTPSGKRIARYVLEEQTTLGLVG